MANFKINIGNWIEYRADGSGDLPSSKRNKYAWDVSSLSPVSVGVIATTSTQVLTGSCLQINTTTTGTDYHYYGHTTGTAPFHIDTNDSIGFTIELQLKVVTAGTYGQKLRFINNSRVEDIKFYTNQVVFDGIDYTHPIDTTDDFHTYRFTVQGTFESFYVDGKYIASGTLPSSTESTDPRTMRIQWGDQSLSLGYGGNFLWSYLRYRLDGAFPPEEKTEAGWVFDDMDISDKRRKAEYPVIRSDNTILSDSNMASSKLKLSGTIVGSCFDSFTNTLRKLKRVLHGGITRVNVDDEKFIEAIHTGFSYKFKTQTFADMKVSMSCRTPYFSQVYPRYFSTAPVAGGTFYITNNSDIPVPCKIIITGSAAGTIDDALTLTNQNTDEECQYRGIISATQELVIDKGYDDFNTYKVELDGSSVYNSYEGDMFTLKTGVNTFIYTGTAAGTIEVYWREGFMI